MFNKEKVRVRNYPHFFLIKLLQIKYYIVYLYSDKHY